MRKPCFDCCRKHLSQALVISHELQWYAGSMGDDHLWYLVGHLAEAGDQIQRVSSFIANEIRDQRLLVMKEGAAAANKLTIARIIDMVTELANELATNPSSSLGAEPDDVGILNPSGSSK